MLSSHRCFLLYAGIILLLFGACSSVTEGPVVGNPDIARSGQRQLHVFHDTIAAVNFTAMGDSCLMRTYDPIWHDHFDLLIRYDTLFAPFGIRDMGVFDSVAAMNPQFRCARDSLDAVVRAREFPIACQNYTTAVPNKLPHYYFLRSGTGETVLLATVGYYIGGLDRLHYYWAVLR